MAFEQDAFSQDVRLGILEAAKRTGSKIIIDDNGPGISEELRDQVFRPFFRLDDSRNLDTGGVGLGLAIARDAIISHGGEIELQDSPTGGLRVMLKLPF